MVIGSVGPIQLRQCIEQRLNRRSFARSLLLRVGVHDGPGPIDHEVPTELPWRQRIGAPPQASPLQAPCPIGVPRSVDPHWEGQINPVQNSLAERLGVIERHQHDVGASLQDGVSVLMKTRHVLATCR